MKTDSTVEIDVVTSAISRTASGWWRARNMMSTAPTNGAHVMIDSTGNGITAVRGEPRRAASRGCSSKSPLGEDEQHEGAEGDAVHVVLGQAALDPPQAVARPQRPRAEHVEDAVDHVAIEPADQPREGQQHEAVEAGEDGVD